MAVVAGLIAFLTPRFQDQVFPTGLGSNSLSSPTLVDTSLARTIEEFDRYFTEAMVATGTPGAAVVIVKDSQIVFCKGYGIREYGKNDPVDGHTVFRIGSLSKGFAGVLAGILVEHGQLAWTDPVRRYFPDFALRDAQQAARIEIRHILSHSTGLPYHAYTQLIEDGKDIPFIVKNYFPKARLGGKEGEFYSYQNAAFATIEPVVKSATGKTYGDLLHEKIFQPIGMANASCDLYSISECPNKAMPHNNTGIGFQPTLISPRYYNAQAAGGVNASALDMGKWIQVLLGNRPDLIQKKTLDEVFRPEVATDRERHVLRGWADREGAFYAKGWRIVKHATDTLVYHGGYVNGYRSEIALNRKDNIGIAILMNAPTPLASDCIPAFFNRWIKFHSR